MFYKVNHRVTLEGNPDDIITTLMREYRSHVYRKRVIHIMDPFNNRTVVYYKSKNKYCPECGTVHGNTIQLIPQYMEDFSKLYKPSTCRLCKDGVHPEVRPWHKEFLEDDHEVASS